MNIEKLMLSGNKIFCQQHYTDNLSVSFNNTQTSQGILNDD